MEIWVRPLWIVGYAGCRDKFTGSSGSGGNDGRETAKELMHNECWCLGKYDHPKISLSSAYFDISFWMSKTENKWSD